MKKQDFKAFIKNKGVYITLILGALIIVAALSINKSLSDAELKKNGLVDLNENPDIVSNDGSKTSMDGTEDRSQFSQMDNDMLLEFDSHVGVLPKPGTNNASAADGSVIIDDSVTADYADAADSSLAAEGSAETDDTAAAGSSSVADASDIAAGTNQQDEDVQQAGTNNVTDVPDDKNTPDPLNENGDDKSAQASGLTTADLSFTSETGLMWPVDGNVILSYSADHAIYHATLKQFKTNPAILISSGRGTEVRASAAGIVTDITETPQTGITLTLAIGDEYSLVYGQLADVKCEIGDALEAGEVFAVINKVSKYYSVEGEHLYFQVLCNGETQNPMLLLNDD